MGRPFHTGALWSTNQVKPLGIPRVNWEHPLASGLIFYGFDTGHGLIVDLVSNRLMNVVGTLPNVAGSPTGPSFNWSGSSAYFNSDALIQNVTLASIWTHACAFIPTASTTGRAFGRTANNNSSPFLNFDFEFGSTVCDCHMINGSAAQAKIGASFTHGGIGSYNVVVGVRQSATTANYYANGAQSGTSTTGLSAGSVNTNDAIMFSGNSTAGVSGAFPGLIPFGAFWGRALTQSDALQLYLTPYCFLLPPLNSSSVF